MNDASQNRVDGTAIIMRLEELCPKLIFVYEGRRRPLAIGIRDQIAERVAGSITPDELNLALRAYTSNTGYLRAMSRPGAQRIDCEGHPVGAVSPEHAAGAAKSLAIRLMRKKARKAEERPKCPEQETATPAGPKRLGLADLKQAALARRA
jgi:sRNA-binding protein